MTGRTATPSTRRDAGVRARRLLALHRRMVSAGLAFTAVLLGLTALTRSPEGASQLSSGSTAQNGSQGMLDEDQLAVPVRLADPAVAALLSVGDVVDVVVADRGGAASLVAADLTVTSVPDAEGSGPWTDSDGVLMVAASGGEVLALAGAAARGPVTIAVHP